MCPAGMLPVRAQLAASNHSCRKLQVACAALPMADMHASSAAGLTCRMPSTSAHAPSRHSQSYHNTQHRIHHPHTSASLHNNTPPPPPHTHTNAHTRLLNQPPQRRQCVTATAAVIGSSCPRRCIHNTPAVFCTAEPQLQAVQTASAAVTTLVSRVTDPDSGNFRTHKLCVGCTTCLHTPGPRRTQWLAGKLLGRGRSMPLLGPSSNLLVT